jgi:hypothetical protein
MMVAGDYTAPALPPPKSLQAVLESAYLASASPEEGRYPQFNILVVPRGTDLNQIGANPFAFDQARPMTVAKLRRLAPASDLRKSAIWVEFLNGQVAVVGLADLGTSWHRARVGLTYAYRFPHALLIEVDRPGRMKVYQGQYLVATLVDGEVSEHHVEFDLFLHKSVRQGLEHLGQHF